MGAGLLAKAGDGVLNRTTGGEGLGTEQLASAGGGWSTAAQGCGCSWGKEVGVGGVGVGVRVGEIVECGVEFRVAESCCLDWR